MKTKLLLLIMGINIIVLAIGCCSYSVYDGGGGQDSAAYDGGIGENIGTSWIAFEDGTIVNKITGLRWTRAPLKNANGTTKTLCFAEAEKYCDELTLAKFDNWRLPDINELRSLIKGCSQTMPDGTCHIYYPDCVNFTCEDIRECRPGSSCSLGNGPGNGGCYWESNVIHGECINYWSGTHSPDEDMGEYYVWSVDFHSAYVWASAYATLSGNLGSACSPNFCCPLGVLCVRQE